MWLRNVWLILTITAIISINSNSQVQSKSISESKIKDQIERKIEIGSRVRNMENITSTTLKALKYDGIEIDSLWFGDIMANSVRNFLPFSYVNKKCTSDGKLFADNLKNQTQWAVQMYDSSSRYPDGILLGGSDNLGNFDQCIDVTSKQHEVSGAFALFNVRFRLTLGSLSHANILDYGESNANSVAVRPETLSWALCFPDSCTVEDVRTSFEHALTSAFRSRNMTVNVTTFSPTHASKDTTMPRSKEILLIWGIFTIGIAIVVTGTSYDVLAKSKNNFTHDKLLRSFSMIVNMRNVAEGAKNKEFAVVSGLKTIGIISVIIGHRVALDLGVPAFNPEYSEHILTDFWLSFLKSPVAVEIFFIVSAFFTYVVIEERLQSGKPLRFILLLFYRFVRILPTYITVILIFAYILPYLGNGPLWNIIVYPEAEFCRKNWWTNILFINNYVNSYEMCMVHSWYLACDMHFFIVGMLLTYILWKWKKAGLWIFGITFVLSIYIPAKFIYDHKQWGVMPYFHSNIKNLRTTEHFQKVYIKSHHRITTYLIGLAAAHVYLRIKRSKLKLSTKSRTIGFIMCLFIHNACYIATGFLYLPGLFYNPWHHLLYFTVQRIAYSLVVSYVLVVSALSNFGCISSVIECKLCTVIARLTYVMYLTHFIIQLQSIGQIRQPQYGNFWTLFWNINADFTSAFWYALPINLIIEAPCRTFFNQLMNTFLKAEHDKSNKDINEKKNHTTEKYDLPTIPKSP